MPKGTGPFFCRGAPPYPSPSDLFRGSMAANGAVVWMDARDEPEHDERKARGAGGYAPFTCSSSVSMSSSEKPKWWPISWIITWRTSQERSSPDSHQ